MPGTSVNLVSTKRRMSYWEKGLGRMLREIRQTYEVQRVHLALRQSGQAPLFLGTQLKAICREDAEAPLNDFVKALLHNPD